MEKDLDFIITRHDFKSVEDIRSALIEAYKAGEKYGQMGLDWAIHDATSKVH